MTDVTFIILGATGELTTKKLIPAIYHLVQNKVIKKFAIIGCARRQILVKDLLRQAKPPLSKQELSSKPAQAAWSAIEKNTHYVQLDFYDTKGYSRLQEKVLQVEKEQDLSGNHLVYLATLPKHFTVISANIARTNIMPMVRRKAAKNRTVFGTEAEKNQGHEEGWCRVAYEKPFGHDLRSAREINTFVSKLFQEEQVYRVDHYLGKELVNNISLARFTNRVLEPLWNRNHVASVEIIMDEDYGVEGRGEFYDQYGALKDVVQNHVLQLLSLIAMEPPKKLDAENIQKEKTRILERMILKAVALGQYKGFRKEPGVRRDSTTETFAQLIAEIDNPRWYGVPIFIRTGKHLRKKETKVVLHFKKVKCLLDTCPREENLLTINFFPEQSMVLRLNAKIPQKNEVAPVDMEFCYSCAFGPNTPEAYQNILRDIILGEHLAFVSTKEIELSWKIIDKIKRPDIQVYQKGSAGPGS